MNVFRVLAVSAAIGGAAMLAAYGIQTAAGVPFGGVERPPAAEGEAPTDGEVGDSAQPDVGSGGEVDDPDPNDLDPNDLDPDDPDPNDPDPVDDPEPDDPEPDDPAIPGEAGADSTVPGPEGAAGADSTVPGPPGADSTVPGPQGIPGPPGPTCPPGSTLQEVVIFQPGGQGDDVPILACVLEE